MFIHVYSSSSFLQFVAFVCVMNGFLMLDQELWEDLEQQKEKYDEDQKTRNEVSCTHTHVLMF